MKTKFNYFIPIILLIAVLSSCKKDSQSSSELKIRYEITTTQNMVTSHTLLGKLDGYVGFTKDKNGNVESDEQLSGKTWVKEVIVQKPSQSMMFGVGGNIYLGSSTGSATTKIYVNNKLEAEVTQSATTMPVSNLSLVIVGANYSYVK